MSEQRRSKEEELLAERLRAEAIDSRPVFCQPLHHRIASAVARRRAAEAEAAGSVPLLRGIRTAGFPIASRRPHIVVAALAAACLLGAIAIGWQLAASAIQQSRLRKTEQMANTTISQMPSIRDLTNDTVGRLDNLTVSAVLEPQTAPLEHDAHAVASVFLDRLPVSVSLANSR
jgi:hypothetical protein